MLAFLLLHFPPSGAASPFALRRSGSARRASQAKQYATGILFLTPSSGSAPQRGEHGLMLTFLLLHFPPSGAASPFAPIALRFSVPIRIRNKKAPKWVPFCLLERISVYICGKSVWKKKNQSPRALLSGWVIHTAPVWAGSLCRTHASSCSARSVRPRPRQPRPIRKWQCSLLRAVRFSSNS